MSPGLDVKAALFYSPQETARIFGKPTAWAYRHATGSGCLAPYARRLGRQLFFVRAAIDRMAGDENSSCHILPHSVESRYGSPTRPVPGGSRHEEEGQ
jgi:hypothetical protein